MPDLGIERLKVKVDTGARTSALHAFSVSQVTRDGKPWVSFDIHPNQSEKETVISCEAPILDQRQVTDSGGHKSMRYVISTTAVMGDMQFPIELTLTDRDTMRFRMLLGRTAMEGRFLVDPEASFLIT